MKVPQCFKVPVYWLFPAFMVAGSFAVTANIDHAQGTHQQDSPRVTAIKPQHKWLKENQTWLTQQGGDFTELATRSQEEGYKLSTADQELITLAQSFQARSIHQASPAD